MRNTFGDLLGFKPKILSAILIIHQKIVDGAVDIRLEFETSRNIPEGT